MVATPRDGADGVIGVLVATLATFAGWSASAPVRGIPARPGYVALDLPFAVDPGSDGSYADLRVVDDRGRLVPAALDPVHRAADGAGAPLPAEIGVVARSGTEAIVDLGDDGRLRDALHLDTAAPVFLATVDIAVSDDRRRWRSAGDDALIWRTGTDGATDTTVRFAPTRSRWLRLRIDDRTRPVGLAAMRFAGSGDPPPPPVRVPLRGVSKAVAGGRRISFDGGGLDVRLCAVRLVTTTPRFARDVTVERETDDGTWDVVARGRVTRFATGAPVEAVSFSEATARRWRVTVDDDDDAPLAELDVVPVGRPHRLVFAAEPARRYTLLWGNPAAPAARFDLAEQLEREDWHAAFVSLDAPRSAPPSLATRLAALPPAAAQLAWLAVGAVLAGWAMFIIRQTGTKEV